VNGINSGWKGTIMGDKGKKRQIDIEWENRTLCSDGNCIGVIGPDGRCKECGLPGPGGPVAEPEASNAGGRKASAIDRAVPADISSPDPSGTDAGKSPDDLDWENRTLCIDGNCIGVIGPDGRCKECGTPFVDDGGGD